MRRFAPPFCLFAAFSLVLSGCAVKRDSYHPPEVDLPERFHEAGKSGISEAEAAEPALPRDLSRWWTRFESDELNALVERALDHNWQVRAAVARLAQAEAALGITRAAELPTLRGFADAGYNAPEDGVGTVSRGDSVTGEQIYRAGLRASYEVDLWGANRAATVAAWERAQATAFARRTVAWTLTADVVDAYLTVLSLEDRIRVGNKTRDLMAELLDAVRQRVEGGEATALQLAQQRTAVAEASSVLPELERQRDAALHALAVLVGTTPGELHLSGDSLTEIAYPSVAPGLPSRLLLRRPDIQQAEHNLLGADADIDVARTAFLPQIGLTTEAGFGSNALSALFRPESLLFNVTASIVQDIFDAGANEARLDFAHARHQELIANYRQAILFAVQDVESALSGVHFLEQRMEAQREAVEAARQSLDFGLQSYDIGVVDYLSLLDTERTLFGNEDTFYQVALQRAQASVALFKALGGDGDSQSKAGERPEADDAEQRPSS